MLLNCFVRLSLTASRNPDLNGLPLIEKTRPLRREFRCEL